MWFLVSGNRIRCTRMREVEACRAGLAPFIPVSASARSSGSMRKDAVCWNPINGTPNTQGRLDPGFPGKRKSPPDYLPRPRRSWAFNYPGSVKETPHMPGPQQSHRSCSRRLQQGDGMGHTQKNTLRKSQFLKSNVTVREYWPWRTNF